MKPLVRGVFWSCSSLFSITVVNYNVGVHLRMCTPGGSNGKNKWNWLKGRSTIFFPLQMLYLKVNHDAAILEIRYCFIHWVTVKQTSSELDPVRIQWVNEMTLDLFAYCEPEQLIDESFQFGQENVVQREQHSWVIPNPSPLTYSRSAPVHCRTYSIFIFGMLFSF